MSIGDMLYNFTDWLRSTQLTELSLWISDTQLSLWIVTHFWAIPTFQTIHILAIGGLFGSAVMIAGRVFGVIGGHMTPAQTVNRYGPWVTWGFVVLVITGLLMIVGEPVRELINPVFWVKMALILLAIPVSYWFNGKVAKIDASGQITASLRLGALLVLILWCAVMAGGRWIAYAPV
jgi:hypothetical protein